MFNGLCTRATLPSGEHRLDPVRFDPYETEYRCLDCGEMIIQYSDNQGC